MIRVLRLFALAIALLCIGGRLSAQERELDRVSAADALKALVDSADDMTEAARAREVRRIIDAKISFFAYFALRDVPGITVSERRALFDIIVSYDGHPDFSHIGYSLGHIAPLSRAERARLVGAIMARKIPSEIHAALSGRNAIESDDIDRFVDAIVEKGAASYASLLLMGLPEHPLTPRAREQLVALVEKHAFFSGEAVRRKTSRQFLNDDQIVRLETAAKK